jgi:NAD(P)H dehydrogenase (quinone)
MASSNPILDTGAAGRVGGIVVVAQRQRNLPVRALVRREDERAVALRATGAEVVVADLTRPSDVETILGRPATSTRDFVARYARSFAL